MNKTTLFLVLTCAFLLLGGYLIDINYHVMGLGGMLFGIFCAIAAILTALEAGSI